jgi:hypothetical protein
MEHKEDSEIARFEAEITRLRSERDGYRQELDSHLTRDEKKISAELKLLSTQLSKEIRDDFFGAIKQTGWILGLLVVVATAGGLLTLSDLISGRINEAVEDRADDVDKLRDEVIQTVVQFKLDAEKALAEIEQLRSQVVEQAGQASITDSYNRRLGGRCRALFCASN